MANIRNKKVDLKDRLAALMIYKKLKEESNPDVFISSTEMTRMLEEEYGKENVPSHNTVAKYLKAMKNYSEELKIDVRRGNSKQGYCLGEREFSPWEMELLISAAMNSKTLAIDNKREVIYKCYKHLGVGEDKIKIITDNLTETENRRKKHKIAENKNIPEILETLNEAIRDKKQVRIYLKRRHSPDSDSSNSLPLGTVSPYKIFIFNDRTYLMYRKESRLYSIEEHPFLLTYRQISDISDVRILDSGNYIPLEDYEPFKNGIDQARFSRDPFGYIRQRENEAVQIEIVSSNEYTVARIKDTLKEEFGENVEFVRQKDRQLAYIYGDEEKCMQFLFWYSNICIVVGPEKWKRKFKSKLIETAKRYDSHKEHYINMLGFINNDDYIEANHLKMAAEEKHRENLIKIRERNGGKPRRRETEEEKRINHSISELLNKKDK